MKLITNIRKMTHLQQKLLNKLLGIKKFIKIKKNFEIEKTIDTFIIFFEFTRDYINKKTKNIRSSTNIYFNLSFADHEGVVMYNNMFMSSNIECLNFYNNIDMIRIYNNYKDGYKYSSRILNNITKDIMDSINPDKQTGSICERIKKAKHNMEKPKWMEHIDILTIYSARFTPQIGSTQASYTRPR